MSGILTGLLVHRITVEPYTGESANGPVYGPPVANVRAFVDQQTRRVTAPNGEQVISGSTAICPLSTVAPAQSRITLADGTVTLVINAKRRDAPGLPTPDHLELQLQ